VCLLAKKHLQVVSLIVAKQMQMLRNSACNSPFANPLRNSSVPKKSQIPKHHFPRQLSMFSRCEIPTCHSKTPAENLPFLIINSELFLFEIPMFPEVSRKKIPNFSGMVPAQISHFPHRFHPKNRARQPRAPRRDSSARYSR
jgi:hypothetical protein